MVVEGAVDRVKQRRIAKVRAKRVTRASHLVLRRIVLSRDDNSLDDLAWIDQNEVGSDVAMREEDGDPLEEYQVGIGDSEEVEGEISNGEIGKGDNVGAMERNNETGE